VRAEVRQDGERPLPAGARAVPLAVWALTGLQLALLLAYSVLMPVYRAPDEPQNFDITMAARDFTEFTGDHRAMGPTVLRSYPFAAFTQDGRRDPVPPEPPAARGERPSFAVLAQPPGTSTTRNQQWQHPPLYPAALGAVLTVTEALYAPAYGWAFDQTVGFARVVNALLVAPLPLLGFLVARRLGGGRAAGLAAAAFPLTIPQLAHIGSAVSHDNLLVLIVGVTTLALAAVLRGDSSPRTARVIGALGGLALLTKGFALFLLAWIPGVYLLAAVRWRRWGFVSAGGLATTLTAALGGWWYVRNVVVHGAVQPTGVHLPSPERGFVPDFGWWASWFADVMPLRFWGNLGWYQAPLPAWLAILATVLVTAAAAAAVLRRRTDGAARTDLLAMSFPVVAVTGIVAYGGWGYYAETSFALGLQGRYLYPGIAGLAVLVGAGATALPGRAGRWAPLALLAAAAAMHSVGASAVLRNVYAAGSALSWEQAAAAVIAWSPWSPVVVVSGLVGLAALLVAAALLLGREARRLAAAAAITADPATDGAPLPASPRAAGNGRAAGAAAGLPRAGAAP